MNTQTNNNLPDSFYEWLQECPVGWVRIKDEENSATYEFISSELDEEE